MKWLFSRHSREKKMKGEKLTHHRRLRPKESMTAWISESAVCQGQRRPVDLAFAYAIS